MPTWFSKRVHRDFTRGYILWEWLYSFSSFSQVLYSPQYFLLYFLNRYLQIICRHPKSSSPIYTTHIVSKKLMMRSLVRIWTKDWIMHVTNIPFDLARQVTKCPPMIGIPALELTMFPPKKTRQHVWDVAKHTRCDNAPKIKTTSLLEPCHHAFYDWYWM